MTNAVSLSALVDSLQIAAEETKRFIDRETGEIVSSMPHADQAIAVKNAGATLPRYEPLPVVSDRDEIEFAHRFLLSVEDPQDQLRLRVALASPDPLSAFLSALYRCRIAHEWFRFRDERLADFVKRWLDDRGIPYVDDVEQGTR
jgi:hypothetical protein